MLGQDHPRDAVDGMLAVTWINALAGYAISIFLGPDRSRKSEVHMSLVAKLFPDARDTQRYDVALNGTLRNPERKPTDVVVVDLSKTGFRVNVASGIAIGDVVTLAIYGIGLRSAWVIREMERQYGCQFLVALEDMELATALRHEQVPEPILLPTSTLQYAQNDYSVDMTDIEKNTIPIIFRTMLIVASSIIAWAFLIYIFLA